MSRTQLPTALDRLAVVNRAHRPFSANPRPFLRWAGSKKALLAQIVSAVPDRFNAYHEPFLGSGAMFFLLQPRQAFLSDVCDELIETYRAVRDRPDLVLRYLSPLKPSRDVYYAMRDNPSRSRFHKAAEFLYINKTCWNGLYRVNRFGKFNVPYGWPKTDNIVDRANLRACAVQLDRQSVQLQTRSFIEALSDVREGDLVFLDPPYVTGHNNNGFVDYNERLFSWEDQIALAEQARRLASSGVHVIVTNANHRKLLELYEGFSLATLSRHSSLSGDASKRGRVEEALLWRRAE